MRVLAITTNASLVVALGSMMREWEVVAVRDLDRATAEGHGSAVALIDLGDTDAGVEMAERLYHNGITIPCVVVGDKPVEGARATVLVRPFSLEELGTAVRDAGTGKAAAIAPAAPPPQIEVETAPQPEPYIEPEPEEPPIAEPPRRRFGLTKVRAPEREAELETEPEVEKAPFDEPLGTPAAQPSFEEEPAYGGDTAAPSIEENIRQAERPPILEHPIEETREVFHEPLPTPRAQQPETSSRWKLGRRAKASVPEQTPAETPLVRRLKIAAAHARELENLIEQMPFLADITAMSEGLVGEIDRQFVCSVASVCVRRDAGFEVVAHRGLSRVEASMVIPDTQSLFNDVLKTREGVLIQPVDLAQGLVAGIGGARTEALMIAPALVNEECVAVVLVGGDQFNEPDLDRLSDLAAEAAPGLAVAQLLDRLRVRSDY